jgi:hypothetical protein
MVISDEDKLNAYRRGDDSENVSGSRQIANMGAHSPGHDPGRAQPDDLKLATTRRSENIKFSFPMETRYST